MPFRLSFYDHNTYHRRFRDTWLQREKEATRPFTFQAKAAEMFENQYKSELLIRSHPRGRGFESLQVHQNENRPKGRFSFCRGPAGVEVYPPCGGNPFRSTKNKPPRRGGFIFVVGLGIRGLCPERVNPFRPTRHSEPSGNWIILNFPFG